jgi:hypothetical protein
MSICDVSDKVCYLTLDHKGGLWYAYPGSWPRWLNWRDHKAFQGLLQGVRSVGVPGTRQNASLLVSLGLYRQAGRMESIQVCSPRCCTDARDRNQPELFLHSASVFTSPASVGGWHELTALEMCSYALVNWTAFADQEQILLAHPAWPALAFVIGLDKESAAGLLGWILDPRWYVDPHRPDRHNRLEQYLGLDRETQWAVSIGRTETGREKRCALVRSCWQKGLTLAPAALDLAGSFLIRGRGHTCPDWQKDLHTSRRFITYLRWTWLDALSPQIGDRLFVPEQFFSTREEAEAYRQHCHTFLA